MRNVKAILLIPIFFAIIGILSMQNATGGETSSIGGASNVITSVPRTMTYQGILKDSTGVPLADSSVSITFRIYDDPVIGTQEWIETSVAVQTDEGGYFSATLSNLNIPFDEDYWLELEIDGQILDPRQKLNMTAYAARADTADYAFNAAGGGTNWTKTGDVVHLVTGTDSVGIGTTTPTEKLEVSGNVRVTGKATIGPNHTNTGSYAFVAGSNNTTSGQQSTVGGGYMNTASQQATTVGGGQQNEASGVYSVVSGGLVNIASGSRATVGGGGNNAARGQFSVVSGGGGTSAADSNSAIGDYSTIGGGRSNTADSAYATIGGGWNNDANNYYATVGGGFGNTASNSAATVSGGSDNTAGGIAATVGGGYKNYVEGSYSAILGGREDTITATADYSYLFGIGSKLTEDSTFMVDMPHIRFGDGINGYEFPISDGSTSGQVMTTNGSGQLSWTDVSGGGGGWTDDGNHVRLETSDDSVGIGTATPTEKLDVTGNIKASGTITSGNSITIDGTTDKITASGGTIDFDDENIVTTGKATIGPGHTNTGVDAFVAGSNNSVSGSQSAIGGGFMNTASQQASVVGGGQQNEASGLYSTVAGGLMNTASGYISAVGGGKYCKARGQYSVVSGGGGLSAADSNSAIGDHSSIGGGKENIAGAYVATVGGGVGNTAGANLSTVGGGGYNNATDYANTIGGGQGNTTSDSYSTIGGGRLNHATGRSSALAGGEQSRADGDYAAVNGGFRNRAIGYYSLVGCGAHNFAHGQYSVVCGGGGSSFADSNSASGTLSFIGGGTRNSATNTATAICGGAHNNASGFESTVGGGFADTSKAAYGGVFSGYSNLAGDAYDDTAAFVGGGYDNSATAICATVSGGRQNDNEGDYSAIPGGYANSITTYADYSMAFGSGVYLNNAYRVGFFNSSLSGRLGINRDDNDIGGIGHPIHVGTNNANGNGARLTVGGVWTNGSSRTFKENFQSLDNQQLLSKISDLQVDSWNFKNSEEKHIGPIAEDFVEAFDVGTVKDDGTRENMYLAAGDVAGVALAGVKELIDKIEALEKRNAELEKRIVNLELSNR